MSEPEDGLREAVQRKGSLARTVSAVAWSFLGIRRGAGLAEDAQKINPVHLVIVGVACVALFVLSLIVLVNWVIASGVAAG